MKATFQGYILSHFLSRHGFQVQRVSVSFTTPNYSIHLYYLDIQVSVPFQFLKISILFNASFFGLPRIFV